MTKIEGSVSAAAFFNEMSSFTLVIVALSGLLCCRVSAQDPASGWMAYAVGEIPAGKERITRLEMTWEISGEADHSRAFYSPWFGMDPDDNLNLIQPVNPWTGSSWSFYTEYYQWKPTHNSNSDSYPAKGGQTLHGSLIYDASSDSYFLNQTLVDTGVSSTQTVPCQDGKKYTVPYGTSSHCFLSGPSTSPTYSPPFFRSFS